MARLIALTEPARRCLRGDFIVLDRFPFKIGRECRLPGGLDGGPPTGLDRRQGGRIPFNHLYISENEQIVHVSREHCQIETEDGEYFLTDRGSLNGTIVEGRPIGGDRAGGRVHLQDHHVIIVGSYTSPFVFKFRAT
jgi:hypothetical protein